MIALACSMCYPQVQSLRYSGEDDDDIRQIALEAVFRCARKHTEARGASFDSLAARYIKTGLMRRIRYYLMAKRRPPGGAVIRGDRPIKGDRRPGMTIMDTIPAAGIAVGDSIEAADTAANVSAVIRNELSRLSDRKRRIVELRYGFDGNGQRTYDEIGHTIGVSKEYVRQVLYRIHEQLRESKRLYDAANGSGG